MSRLSVNFIQRFSPPQRPVRRILERLIRGKQASSGEVPIKADEQMKPMKRPENDPVKVELLSAASKLVEATENVFNSVSEPAFTKSDFQQRSIDLLGLYDEYLAVVKREIDVQRESDGTTIQLSHQELIKLFVAFDHDRDLVAGVLALIQQELFGTGPDPSKT
jgi:hypothetical protein